MRVIIVLAAILAVMAVSSQADRIFNEQVYGMNTFDQLIATAKNESKSVNTYIDQETVAYAIGVVANNETLNALLEQFEKDEEDAEFRCLMQTLHYSLTKDWTKNKIKEYNKLNVTAYLERNYARQINVVHKNVQKVQDAADEAEDLKEEAGKENDIKNLLNNTKRDIINAHKDFYDAAQKEMRKKIDDIYVEMNIKRGKVTKKGLRLRKCNLGY